VFLCNVKSLFVGLFSQLTIMTAKMSENMSCALRWVFFHFDRKNLGCVRLLLLRVDDLIHGLTLMHS